MQYPVISSAKDFSGEIRKDFRAIMDAGMPPTERLALILKHTDYELSESERLKAIEAIGGLGKMNVYSIAISFKNRTDLKALAEAIETGFEFKDKTTPRWGLLYALVAKLPSGEIVAELGVTEKCVSFVMDRLSSAKVATHNTKIGKFLHFVEQHSAPCYLFSLESHSGCLDVLGYVKDRWKLAGLMTGVKFPTREHTEWSLLNSGKQERVWPLFEDVVQFGLKVR